jgi:putative transposase
MCRARRTSETIKQGVQGRVYLTSEQAAAAARQFGCARFVYNHLLAFSQSRYVNKIKTSATQRSLELTRLKTEIPWLQEVNAQSLQQTGRALDTAYKNWLDSITGKRPDQVKPPQFKKKSKRQSARFTKRSFRFENDTLSLSKIGDLHIPWYRRVKGEPSSVVLSRTPSGRYYVSLQVEQQPLRVVGGAQNQVLSVDINTKAFHFFNGRTWSQVELPRPLLVALSRLRRAQKHLSRCEKGSQNREKARIKVARIYQRASDVRTDFLQKLSTQLVHENQVILVETLRTKNMLKNRRLARAIADAGFGGFLRMLEYKCKWYGRTLVKVDPFFPSSKLCCICHQKNAELKLQDRWRCPHCQTEHQRDENAIVNIFVEGLRILAEGRSVKACAGTVRPKREPRRAPVKQETSLETSSNAA